MKKNNDLKVFAYSSNGLHPGMKRLRETAKKFNIDLEAIGTRNRSSGKGFRWQQKLDDFSKALHTRVRGDTFVLLCDGYDVRFMASSDEIIECYLDLVPDKDRVLICGERKYVHHHTKLPSSHWSSNELYCYPSSCMVMGPRKLVMHMVDSIEKNKERLDLNHCCCGSKPYLPCDQSMMSLWLSRQTNQDSFCIDTTSKVFWSTRGEHKEFMKLHGEVVKEKNGSRRLKNKNTGETPCVIHVPTPLSHKSRVNR